MVDFKAVKKFEEWADSCLNFEKTPQKNIFWLDTMNYFCQKFNNPQNSCPCIHIGGSKGKGSISTFIASILDQAGYKTGIYTSPHILSFVERITSTKGFFSEEVYSSAAEEIMEVVNKINPEELPAQRPITWFELVTLYAFLVFRKARTDYTVYEVGLGGRLDATNVIQPEICCIGPIEKEHTEYLGDTLEKIAFEKAGIIKNNTPVIIAPQKESVKEVFKKAAAKKNAPVFFIDEVIDEITTEICGNYSENSIKNNTTLDLFYSKTTIKSPVFSRPLTASLKLLGDFQAQNAALAAVAVKKLLPQLSEEVIEKGLSKATLPARFEIIPSPAGYKNIPYLILDGAHTKNSIAFTIRTMDSVLKISKMNTINLLFGCAADKDVNEISNSFKNKFQTCWLTKPGNVKTSDPKKMKEAFANHSITFNYEEDFSVQIKKALAESSGLKTPLLVTGSFYLVSEVKKILSEQK